MAASLKSQTCDTCDRRQAPIFFMNKNSKDMKMRSTCNDCVFAATHRITRDPSQAAWDLREDLNDLVDNIQKITRTAVCDAKRGRVEQHIIHDEIKKIDPALAERVMKMFQAENECADKLNDEIFKTVATFAQAWGSDHPLVEIMTTPGYGEVPSAQEPVLIPVEKKAVKPKKAKTPIKKESTRLRSSYTTQLISLEEANRLPKEQLLKDITSINNSKRYHRGKGHDDIVILLEQNLSVLTLSRKNRGL